MALSDGEKLLLAHRHGAVLDYLPFLMIDGSVGEQKVPYEL